MTEALREYRRLKDELIYMRWLHRGYECPEEGALVEALAEAWRPLSPSERALIRGEGHRTLLREGDHLPTVEVVDARVFSHPGAALRELREAA
ncbi:hypothetical protein L6R50_19075 [Myxococcota bacterium]|nr:hypothetical protein [Myxococcota bacterium]